MRNHSTSQGTFSCGFLLAVIGIFIFCFAFLLPQIVNEKAKQESRQTIVVNSNSSEYYASWQNNSQQDMDPYIEAFTFMNLTNPDLVLKGQKPVFQEVGPYYYRVERTKQKVSFSEDMKNVSYVPYDIWYYDEKRTDKSLNPHKDVITNLNFGFIGLMLQSETENAAISGYVSIIWRNWLSGIFQHEFMDDSIWTYGFDYFQEALGKIMDDFVHKNGKTLPEAQNIVWQAWANYNKTGNVDGIDFPDVLKVSLNTNPLNINEESTQKLFNDSHVEYSLSYKSPFNNSVLKVWKNSPSDNDIKTKILTTFNINAQQLDSIINWLKSERFQQWVQNKLETQFKLKNYTDLFLLQFATGSVTKNVPLINIYPKLLPSTSVVGDYKSPELFFGGGYNTGDGGKPFTVESVRKLLYGTYGFTGGPLNIKLFKTYQNAENWTYLNDTWGVTQENIMGLTICMIMSHIQVAKYEVMGFVTKGSGIITSRVAHKWMFDACDDPLINNFLGYTKCVNFRHNATMDNTKPFITYTGYKNISLIANYISWNGTTTSAFGDKVNGTNTDGQFAPFDYDHVPNMTIFEESYQRTLQLIPEKERVTFNGISLVDYRLSTDTWSQNNVPGYNVTGFSWIGPSYEKIPIYFSNPYYYQASKDWLNRVDIHPPPPASNDTYSDTRPLYTKTYIDFLTGKVMWANKCVQINIYLKNETILGWFEFDTFGFKGLTGDVMWPITYIRQHGQASEKQVALYKDKFKLLTSAKNFGLVGGIAGGVLFIVIGVIISTIGVISMNKHQTYETLNSGPRIKK